MLSVNVIESLFKVMTSVRVPTELLLMQKSLETNHYTNLCGILVKLRIRMGWATNSESLLKVGIQKYY